MKRITLIVLDSVGCGSSPDAGRYGDDGSHTLAHVAEVVPDLKLPNLIQLGLGHIENVGPFARVRQPRASYGRMQERSVGKDTTTGHWELAGLVLDKPFPLFPEGFPKVIVEALEKAFDRSILANKPASGTVIINELGDEHVRTGSPIVYTSADSVLQIAAHESVIPVPELYSLCRKARHIMQGEYAVGRIIARPFIGENGSYRRTANRRDFSLEPFAPTLLDKAKDAGYSVIGVGKIKDIYAGRGLTEAFKTANNEEGIDQINSCLDREFKGLLIANLVDFDSLYGHRNNPEGYARALEAFDKRLPEIISRIGPEDMLVLTADHGCDPTWPTTDHTREYVPLLVYGPQINHGVDLGTRSCFCDLAATLCDVLKLDPGENGISFLPDLVRPGS